MAFSLLKSRIPLLRSALPLQRPDQYLSNRSQSSASPAALAFFFSVTRLVCAGAVDHRMRPLTLAGYLRMYSRARYPAPELPATITRPSLSFFLSISASADSCAKLGDPTSSDLPHPRRSKTTTW